MPKIPTASSSKARKESTPKPSKSAPKAPLKSILKKPPPPPPSDESEDDDIGVDDEVDMGSSQSEEEEDMKEDEQESDEESWLELSAEVCAPAGWLKGCCGAPVVINVSETVLEALRVLKFAGLSLYSPRFVKSFRALLPHGDSAIIESWNSEEVKTGSAQSMLSPPR